MVALLFSFAICLVHHQSHGTEAGHVLVLGQGDVGQLGLGEDILERKKPAPVTLPEDIVQVAAGGMHTVCVSASGSVCKHSTVTESSLYSLFDWYLIIFWTFSVKTCNLLNDLVIKNIQEKII